MTHAAIQPLSMRWLWTFVLVAVLASAAHAGVTGRVSAIGFQSFIRADDWVPLVVQTTSDEPAARTFDLQVVQNDQDGDEVVYTRPGITVNPGTQTFRTRFRPETLNGGLPASGTDAASDLVKRLRVFLFDPATGKRAVRVGVAGALPQAMGSGQLSGPVGQKLILVVGRSPNFSEFVPARNRLIGQAEACYFVQVDPNRLPDSALAYGAVDAVVWTDADTSARGLDASQLRALRHYVQGGGLLAVVHHADARRTDGLKDLLPVKVRDSVEWSRAEPLRSILQPPGESVPGGIDAGQTDAWRGSRPPYRMADAEPVDATTIVDEWVRWPDGRRTPYIARRLYGLGCVAWIAQDIADPSLTAVNFGWPRLWQRLLDCRDVDLAFAAAESAATIELAKARYAADTPRDIGASFVREIEPVGLTVTKISVAFVFFVGYWLVAGPGSYLVLASRRRTSLSWLVYGAIAAGATALTVLIAQGVLRGPPQVRHISLVRVPAGGGEPARVRSRIGIYLPKDTRAAVALAASPEFPPAALTPLGTDPRYSRTGVNLRDSSYDVPLDAGDDASVELAIPFRSTLKKLQADWSGLVPGGISGRPTLSIDDTALTLDGRVSNDTGTDLSDVVFVFRGPDQSRGDWVLAMPEWKKGQTFELGKLWKEADAKPISLTSGRPGLPLVGNVKPIRGRWADAVTWIYDDLRLTTSIGVDVGWDDGPDYNRSFPLVSLFGRCPPMVNYPKDQTRVDILRRGLRQWDVSPAVAAGAMVVLAKTTGPLPIPLTVDGDTPAGSGRTFYQAVLPVDRSATLAPDPVETTQPEN